MVPGNVPAKPARVKQLKLLFVDDSTTVQVRLEVVFGPPGSASKPLFWLTSRHTKPLSLPAAVDEQVAEERGVHRDHGQVRLCPAWTRAIPALSRQLKPLPHLDLNCIVHARCGRLACPPLCLHRIAFSPSPHTQLLLSIFSCL